MGAGTVGDNSIIPSRGTTQRVTCDSADFVSAGNYSNLCIRGNYRFFSNYSCQHLCYQKGISLCMAAVVLISYNYTSVSRTSIHHPGVTLTGPKNFILGENEEEDLCVHVPITSNVATRKPLSQERIGSCLVIVPSTCHLPAARSITTKQLPLDQSWMLGVDHSHHMVGIIAAVFSCASSQPPAVSP